MDDHITDQFEIKIGVRQGCILSPFLFSLVIDDGLRKCDEQNYGISWMTSRLYDLDFADDIALFDQNAAKLQECTDDVKRTMNGVGLRFTVKKCKVMAIGSNASQYRR